MKQRIPFVPVSVDKAKRMSKRFIGLGEAVSKMFPGLAFELEQADYDIEPREWGAIAIYFSMIYSIYAFCAIFVVTMAANFPLLTSFQFGIPAGLAFGLVVFMYLGLFPRLFISRRVKEIEKHMPTALHHMLIQVRSGVTLSDSLVSIARSSYGLLSQEFGRAVNEITTGVSEISALEMLARNNPSLYFRRVLWQIINALKSGADIGMILKEIVDNMVEEQRVEIKRYGSELNPLALFYMLLVVVFPTLGIIFMLILFSFVGTIFNVEFLLLGILFFLFFVQFMFMGIIKSKRPPGI